VCKKGEEAVSLLPAAEGKKMVEPAEKENQKPGGRLLFKKKMGLGLGFFVFFSDVVKTAPSLFEL